jgi:hypothetical protein
MYDLTHAMMSPMSFVCCRFPNPLPYPVDDEDVILGGWTSGFQEVAAPQQKVSGKQRYMMALPFMWDMSCAQGGGGGHETTSSTPLLVRPSDDSHCDIDAGAGSLAENVATKQLESMPFSLAVARL